MRALAPVLLLLLLLLCFLLPACRQDTYGPPRAQRQTWESDNPLRPIPAAPLGIDIDLSRLPIPPTPQRARLGRWLFFDARLSGDGTLSCASCHQPAHAFSSTSPVATGIGGQRGTRKIPTIVNLAAIPQRPRNFETRPRPGPFFWDGRAPSLERQALEPIANPIEMGSSHARMEQTLSRIGGYRPYFVEAFGDARITRDRVAQALADYERTRMSGNSSFDRWHTGKNDQAVAGDVKRGFALFAGTAQCIRCHPAPLFTDGGFHNLGVGWDPAARTFADEGRHAVTRGSVTQADPGTFKTPTLREVSRRAPYMHDGSIGTLREVVEFYNRGGIPNPDLDNNIRPLGLSSLEVEAIVAFLRALDGEGWQDVPPSHFPH
jgi:cytochrome c peroxidase